MFWTLDFIKGGKIRRHYNEIRQIMENPMRDVAQRARKRNLQEILQHASMTTPHYAKYIDHQGLSHFPVINKNVVLDNYENFKSQSFKNTTLFKASSSGSTGIPFSIYQDKTKRNRNIADVIYFSAKGGSQVGNRLVYIKLWDHTNIKNKGVMFAQNIMPHNVMASSQEEIADLLSKMEKDPSNKSILGYPSFFEEICKYLDGKKVYPKINKVRSIISFAEGLKDYEREKMALYFGAPVYERYSNQENGILAQQTDDSDGKYVLNCASFFIEILELTSDKHVKKGGLGRIVVTDLFNFSMPMIRYDTGDLATYEGNYKGLPVLGQIYGRRTDIIYNTNGEIVSPFIFYRVLEFSKIKQFQFVQTGEKNYVFKLNGKPEDVDETGIGQFFKEYLGEDADIGYHYVREIPVLSSGKRKKIVNLWTTD